MSAETGALNLLRLLIAAMSFVCSAFRTVRRREPILARLSPRCGRRNLDRRKRLARKMRTRTADSGKFNALATWE